MISWFSKGPNFVDEEFADLSLMLTQDDSNVTYRRDALDPAVLNFSLESLRHIDAYLELLRKEPPIGGDFLRVVLRTGAYVGEVMRKQSPRRYHWVAYAEAAKHSKFLRGSERTIASAAVLWRDSSNISFPLGKVCKYLENGDEDSVYSFAKVLLERN